MGLLSGGGAPSLRSGPSPCAESSTAWTFPLRVEGFVASMKKPRCFRIEAFARPARFTTPCRAFLRCAQDRGPPCTRAVPALVHSGSSRLRSERPKSNKATNLRLMALLLPARPARFELATFGSVGGNGGLAADSNKLQGSGTVRVGTIDRVQRVAEKATNRRRLVTTLLQEAAGKGVDSARKDGGETEDRRLEGEVRLMTVKDVAGVLRVCTATVYAMIERGELEHARVSNSIRVVLRKCKA